MAANCHILLDSLALRFYSSIDATVSPLFSCASLQHVHLLLILCLEFSIERTIDSPDHCSLAKMADAVKVEPRLTDNSESEQKTTLPDKHNKYVEDDHTEPTISNGSNVEKVRTAKAGGGEAKALQIQGIVGEAWP